MSEHGFMEEKITCEWCGNRGIEANMYEDDCRFFCCGYCAEMFALRRLEGPSPE